MIAKNIFSKLRIRAFDYKRKIQIYLGSINVLRAYYWGIKLGKNPKFRGHCFFKKAYSTEITIGDNFSAVSIVKESNLVKRPCTIQTNRKGACLKIGNNVRMSGCIIACFKNIKIGDNVRIGGNCTIFDGDFHLDDSRVGQPRDIVIEDNVWLGYEVIVLKGVHIGANSVIGAGSVVTKDIPSNSVAAGNPCKIIKKIDEI
ncbi:Putative acetyltransferase SACOL2570 [uncultured Bacteroides sp.]|uniref:acyltransferase n=1 Tax=Bacteroides cellulolyticus TaxID=2981780 RepID=UPI000822DDD0|nr:acyltransferase [Bacteroides cellulolyticus]MCU6770344.1 acyltransferase [Bacteroides cellulolyticus]SCH06278.1 Putative acetyltransferase SACOL2570 [uncultured Bacteroides sp.]